MEFAASQGGAQGLRCPAKSKRKRRQKLVSPTPYLEAVMGGREEEPFGERVFELLKLAFYYELYGVLPSRHLVSMTWTRIKYRELCALDPPFFHRPVGRTGQHVGATATSHDIRCRKNKLTLGADLGKRKSCVSLFLRNDCYCVGVSLVPRSDAWHVKLPTSFAR